MNARKDFRLMPSAPVKALSERLVNGRDLKTLVGLMRMKRWNRRGKKT